MVIPLPGGGHEVSRVHRRKNVYKQKSEHGCTIHCNATASGPLQGDDTERQGKGDNEVVVPEGDGMGETKARRAEMELESDPETDMEEEETRESESGASSSSGAECSGASVDQWEVNEN